MVNLNIVFIKIYQSGRNGESGESVLGPVGEECGPGVGCVTVSRIRTHMLVPVLVQTLCLDPVVHDPVLVSYKINLPIRLDLKIRNYNINNSILHPSRGGNFNSQQFY